MVTITLPLSGKLFCLDRVFSSLSRLLIPDADVRWVILDNSGSSPVRAAVRGFLRSLPADHHKITLSEPPGKFISSDYLYNYLSSFVFDNWFSVEDDICDIPPDTLSRFYREVYRFHDLAIIAAHVASRCPPVESLCWRFGAGVAGQVRVRAVAPGVVGVGLVDAVHTGCTLLRPAAYLGHTFQQIHQDHERFLGHDLHLGLCLRDKSLRVGVMWDLRPAHWTAYGPVYPTGCMGPASVTPDLPLVSVITPTADRPGLLQQVVRDLQAQTYKNWECLVCSDGPSSRTARLISDFDDSRLRYYELSYCHGFSGAPQRNAMVQRVGGELVVFVDDDVSLEPDYLTTLVSLWRAGYRLGFGQVRVRDGAGEEQVVPATREACLVLGSVDTLCGFVDTSIARGFSWDLFNGHDHRYFLQIATFLRGDYGFTPRVIGKVHRHYGRPEEDKNKLSDLTQQISLSCLTSFPEAESLILTDPVAVLNYVLNGLEGARWEQGEPVLARNPRTALFYTQNVLRGERFEAAEDILAQDLGTAVAYARIVGRSWVDLGRTDVDTAIRSHPVFSLNYNELYSEKL